MPLVSIIGHEQSPSFSSHTLFLSPHVLPACSCALEHTSCPAFSVSVQSMNNISPCLRTSSLHHFSSFTAPHPWWVLNAFFPSKNAVWPSRLTALHLLNKANPILALQPLPPSPYPWGCSTLRWWCRLAGHTAVQEVMLYKTLFGSPSCSALSQAHTVKMRPITGHAPGVGPQHNAMAQCLALIV